MSTAAPMLTTLAQRLDRNRSALLVIDMQNDFCAADGYVATVIGKDTTACRAVAAPIMALVEDARQHGVPIFWIVAQYDPDRIPAPMRAKQLEKSEAVACATESWGASFHGVTPEPGEAVIVKRNYSAFIGTDLREHLAEQRRDVLVFAGVQTNVCVENSVRDAFCMGFYCIVASDCVASHTSALHEATLANVRFLYGDVIPSAAIVGGWTSSPNEPAHPPI